MGVQQKCSCECDANGSSGGTRYGRSRAQLNNQNRVAFQNPQLFSIGCNCRQHQESRRQETPQQSHPDRQRVDQVPSTSRRSAGDQIRLPGPPRGRRRRPPAGRATSASSKMERMAKLASVKRELHQRIQTQYLTPLKSHVEAKDPETVTLAEHTRLYKLEALVETLSKSCEFHDSMAAWYSGAVAQESLPQNFTTSLETTLDELEKATVAIDHQWSNKSTIARKVHGESSVDATTFESQITNLHKSLEAALGSLRRLLLMAEEERVPLQDLKLSESDVGMVLLQLPLPYGKGGQFVELNRSTAGSP